MLEDKPLRHRGLNSLCKALKVGAWFVLVLGIAAVVAGIAAGQQSLQLAAQRGLGATGMGVAATTVSGGILGIVMAVVWFLTLYAIAEIGETTADLWARSSAATVPTARPSEIIPEPTYTPTRPPAGAPG